MDLSFLVDEGLQALPAFATSLAIGLLIGLERERRPEAKAGLRTFALVALFGTLSAMLSEQLASPWILAVALLTTGLMIVAAYLQDETPKTDPGTTTVAAVLVAFCLGAVVWFGHATLAVMLAIVSTVLLYFKAELKGLTERLTRTDLVSILQFAVLSLVVLPILPDRSYPPFDTLNPHQVWLMVVLIAGVSLAGYVALRIFGARAGAPLLGVLGGLVSSTATTTVYARHARSQDDMVALSVVVILLANLVVLVRMGVLMAVAAPRVLPALLPVLGTALGLGLAATLLRWRGIKAGGATPVPEVKNPTEIRTALAFGAAYALVLVLAAALNDAFGAQGLYAVAAVSGLTDVDAITLSSARLFQLGQLQSREVTVAVTIALLANLAFKLGIVLVVGGGRLARSCGIPMLAIGFGAVAGLVAWGLAS
jgi:uncharacterized membrane protein (DUF4010 family)